MLVEQHPLREAGAAVLALERLDVVRVGQMSVVLAEAAEHGVTVAALLTLTVHQPLVGGQRAAVLERLLADGALVLAVDVAVRAALVRVARGPRLEAEPAVAAAEAAAPPVRVFLRGRVVVGVTGVFPLVSAVAFALGGTFLRGRVVIHITGVIISLAVAFALDGAFLRGRVVIRVMGVIICVAGTFALGGTFLRRRVVLGVTWIV